MLDVELFGPSPGWHHRMNVLYHLLNTELLFLVLWRMTGALWQGAFVAALFGAHPLHVESAMWISERKDLLCALFFLLATAAYRRYVRRPGTARYLPVAALFALALLCKPMAVTFPFVLLLLDYWPLGRMEPAGSPRSPLRLLLEKAPLLALSALSCAATFLAQTRGGAVSRLEDLPFPSRAANAVVSYAVYLGKAAWPSSLSVFYPHPASIPAWEVAGASILLAGITFLAFLELSRRPYLAVGWLWYLGTLVPVIGLVQVGGQSLADRYTYLPLTGVFIAAAWGFPSLVPERPGRRAALWGLALALTAALSLSARAQAGYWRDSLTLLSRAESVTERNWFALNNLGNYYYARGEDRKAAGYYREALLIKPNFAQAYNNLGMAYRKLGMLQQAIASSREALRLKGDLPEAWYNLGASCDGLGLPEEAVAAYREAVRLRPDYAAAWVDLGVAYGRLGRYPEAIGAFREALRIRPDFAEAWYNLGNACGKSGLRSEAIGSFREALRIRPDFAAARARLSEAEGRPVP